MKSAPVSFLTVMLAVLAGAPSAPASSRTVYGRSGKTKGQLASLTLWRASPHEYLSLADWAKANRLEVHWLKRDETIELRNHSARIVLTVDSCVAEVNGIQVWLSFPVVDRNGSVSLARLDLQSTLRPLLILPQNQSGAKIRSVCLDPGHGGKDPGNRVGSYEEKTYTLLLAQEVRQQLARAGFKVSLTRSRDEFIELPNRPDAARRRNADVFLSLHFYSADSGRGDVRGAEVYCLTPPGASSTNARGEGAGAGWSTGNSYNDKNLFLAYQMQKNLTRSVGLEDRGVRRARFAVLRDAPMPAVLIEAGFMSHPAEGRKIFNAAYRVQLARAIVDGLLAYKRQVEQKT
jgi:N-acetylmuramoyl-L-alanine amidase